MHFLRTLFWVIVAVAMLIFAVQNNGVVTVNLWGGLQADVKLWLLALGPFLLGFLPTWIFGRVNLWRQQREASAAARRALERSFYEASAKSAETFAAGPGPGPAPAPAPGAPVAITVSPPIPSAPSQSAATWM